jgi:hypothetical protein
VSGTQNDPESELVSEESGRSIAINAEEYPDLATLVRFASDDDVDGYLRAIGIDEETIEDEDEIAITTVTAEAVELDDAGSSTLNGDDEVSET